MKQSGCDARGARAVVGRPTVVQLRKPAWRRLAACERAYLGVLTVNAVGESLGSVVLRDTNLWLAEPQSKMVQTLIDSVLFLSNVYCQ